MSNAGALFGQLLEFLRVSQHSGWSKAAALTLLTCDILNNLHDEIRHVWRSKLSLVKVAYFFVRYWAIIYIAFEFWASTHPQTKEFCGKYYFYFYSYGGDMLYTTAVNVISVVRIYALYGRSKKILAFFIFLSMVEFGTEFYTTWRTLETTAKNTFNPPFTDLVGCYTTAPPNIEFTLIAWIPCIFVSFCFFAFTLWKLRESVSTLSGGSTLSALRSGAGMSPLLMIFVRDGSVFFLLIFAIMVTATYVTFVKSGLYHTPVHPWLHTVFSVACSHLVLNLHSYGNQGRPTMVDTVQQNSAELYSMKFRSRGKSLNEQSSTGSTLYTSTGVVSTTASTAPGVRGYPEYKSQHDYV